MGCAINCARLKCRAVAWDVFKVAMVDLAQAGAFQGLDVRR